jgi:hypothetical protein
MMLSPRKLAELQAKFQEAQVRHLMNETLRIAALEKAKDKGLSERNELQHRVRPRFDSSWLRALVGGGRTSPSVAPGHPSAMESSAMDTAKKGERRDVCASDGFERVGCVQCGELEAEVAKLKAARKEQKQKLAERDSAAVQVRWRHGVRPVGFGRGPDVASRLTRHLPSNL